MQALRARLHRRQPPTMAALTPEQITSIVVSLLAGSEILSLLPGVKANGWVQLILAALRGIASRKR